MNKLDNLMASKMASIFNQLEEIETLMQDVPAPESPELNWAHHGNVAHVESLLAEVIEFLSNKSR